MSAPDVSSPQGFKQYANGVAAMAYANRVSPGLFGDPHRRVVESANVMESCGFDDDELRAMLAVAIDMMAFPDEWKGVDG